MEVVPPPAPTTSCPLVEEVPEAQIREDLAQAQELEQAWVAADPLAPETEQARRRANHLRQQLRWVEDVRWADRELATIPRWQERGRGGARSIADLWAARCAGSGGPRTSERWRQSIRRYCRYHTRCQGWIGSLVGWVEREGGEAETVLDLPEAPPKPPARDAATDQPDPSNPWECAVEEFEERTGEVALAAHLRNANTSSRDGALTVAMASAWALRLWLDASDETKGVLREAVRHHAGTESIDVT